MLSRSLASCGYKQAIFHITHKVYKVYKVYKLLRAEVDGGEAAALVRQHRVRDRAVRAEPPVVDADLASCAH